MWARRFSTPTPSKPIPVDQLASLQDLVKDLDAGAVDLLLILGGNPAFNAPVELGMRDRIQKAQACGSISSLYEDETSEVCQWHLPETHFLETWGDARAFDGTVTIQQPLIQPLYDGRSALPDAADAYREPGAGRVRHRQGILGGAAQGRGFRSLVAPRGARWRGARIRRCPPKTPCRSRRGDCGASRSSGASEGKLEVIFRPDPTIYDGRFANNGWLQELPKPITKLTWDNAAIMSPRDGAPAERRNGRHAAS